MYIYTLNLALFYFVFQGQICLLLQVSLDFLLFYSISLWWKVDFFSVLVLEGLVIELVNFSFFSISGWAIDLDYCDAEWFALEANQNHSVIFEIAPKYCILDSFIDLEASSISSKELLPTAVDMMII